MIINNGNTLFLFTVNKYGISFTYTMHIYLKKLNICSTRDSRTATAPFAKDGCCYYQFHQHVIPEDKPKAVTIYRVICYAKILFASGSMSCCLLLMNYICTGN
jgi:hypothetical protein